MLQYSKLFLYLNTIVTIFKVIPRLGTTKIVLLSLPKSFSILFSSPVFLVSKLSLLWAQIIIKKLSSDKIVFLSNFQVNRISKSKTLKLETFLKLNQIILLRRYYIFQPIENFKIKSSFLLKFGLKTSKLEHILSESKNGKIVKFLLFRLFRILDQICFMFIFLFPQKRR